MQAYETKPTDLTREAYYCQSCDKTFLGRPRESPQPGYFDGNGDWIVSGDRFTVAYTCDDNPPCDPVLELIDDNFIVGTLADLVSKIGIGSYIDRDGKLVLIQRSGSWSCGNCESIWSIADFGKARAESRAVHCCQ